MSSAQDFDGLAFRRFLEDPGVKTNSQAVVQALSSGSASLHGCSESPDEQNILKQRRQSGD
jgi:hypothetical protein